MDKSKTNSPRKQKQLGPAPIASFEDTSSDELKFKVNVLEYCVPNTHKSGNTLRIFQYFWYLHNAQCIRVVQ